MIRYKIDIMESLKEKGYSSYKLRKDKIFGEATIQKFRNKEYINFDNLEKLCFLLECQPSDIIEYVKEDNWRIRFYKCFNTGINVIVWVHLIIQY